MSKHLAKAHRVHTRENWKQHITANYVSLSLDGMPTCIFCKRRFWGWPELNLHIAFRQFSGLQRHYEQHGESFHQIAPAGSFHKPRIQDPEVVARLRQGSWFHLIRLPQVMESLKHHCPICHKFILQTGYIKGRIRSKHPQHAALLSRCETRVKTLTTSRPCV